MLSVVWWSAALMGAGAVALAALGRRRGRGRRVEVAVSLAALAVTGGAMVSGAFLVHAALGRVWERPPWWAVGLWAGWSLAALPWAFRGAEHLARRVTGRHLDRTARRALVRELAVDAVGGAALGVGLLALLQWAAGAGSWGRLVLPAGLALHPLWQAAFKPWLLFLRVPPPESHSLQPAARDLESWTLRIAGEQGLGRIRLVVWPGDVVNAFAVGFAPFGRWVVVGEGLLRRFEPDEVRAVVAHELAHVIRRDTAVLLAAGLLCGTVYALLLSAALRWLEIEGLLGHVVAAGAIAGVVLGWLPARLSRRLELGADRLSVRLVANPDSLCSALLRFAEISGSPVDRPSATHPSVRQRIDHIRAATP